MKYLRTSISEIKGPGPQKIMESKHDKNLSFIKYVSYNNRVKYNH